MTHILAVVGVSTFGLSFARATLPHIIFVLYDDLGYNDAGWRASGPSDDLAEAWPTTSAMARKGVMLGQYYTQPICTPSRGALLTGQYPVNLGLQHDVINPSDIHHLPIAEITLAQILRDAGYRTIGVGKWHLGGQSDAVVPTARGFDEFYGYWLGWSDYWNHTAGVGLPGDCDPKSCFLDLHDNLELDSTQNGIYSTFLFDQKVHEMLEKQATEHKDSPFFLYYAMQNVHSPLQTPSWALEEPACNNITTTNRKHFCALAVLADAAFHNLTQAVSSFFFQEPVVYIVSGDNGGAVHFGGNNLPLRGAKFELWEGGVRNNAFIWSNSNSIMPHTSQGTTYNNMFHITDWYPTILDLAQYNKSIGKLDGVSHLAALWGADIIPRTEFVVNIDPCNTAKHGSAGNTTEAAYRYHEWKLLLNAGGGHYHPLSGTDDSKKSDRVTGLFNVIEDPEERHNMFVERPDMVDIIVDKIKRVKAKMVQPCNCGRYCQRGVAPCPPDVEVSIEAARKAGGWVPWVHMLEQVMM